MNKPKIIFRVHAVQRMFGRKVSARSISQALQSGELIEDYSAEMPERSKLLLDFQGKRPFHIVVSENLESNEVTIITVYLPDPHRWDKKFRNRKP